MASESIRLTPAASAAEAAPARSACTPMWVATRAEEQAVSTETAGPAVQEQPRFHHLNERQVHTSPNRAPLKPYWKDMRPAATLKLPPVAENGPMACRKGAASPPYSICWMPT